MLILLETGNKKAGFPSPAFSKTNQEFSTSMAVQMAARACPPVEVLCCFPHPITNTATMARTTRIPVNNANNFFMLNLSLVFNLIQFTVHKEKCQLWHLEKVFCCIT